MFGLWIFLSSLLKFNWCQRSCSVSCSCFYCNILNRVAIVALRVMKRRAANGKYHFWLVRIISSVKIYIRACFTLIQTFSFKLNLLKRFSNLTFLWRYSKCKGQNSSRQRNHVDFLDFLQLVSFSVLPSAILDTRYRLLLVFSLTNKKRFSTRRTSLYFLVSVATVWLVVNSPFVYKLNSCTLISGAPPCSVLLQNKGNILFKYKHLSVCILFYDMSRTISIIHYSKANPTSC